MFDRHGAVDVSGAAEGVAAHASSVPHSNSWRHSSAGDRLSVCAGRAALLRSHAARSADCSSEDAGVAPPAGAGSPRGSRRAPRESRRVSVAHAHGYVQLNQYRLLEPIGQGSYGIVKLAYNEEDETHYAMKILSKRKLVRRAGLFGRTPPPRRPSAPHPVTTPLTANSLPVPPSDPLHRIYREIAVLKKLDHPNVVKLVEVLDDPAEDQLYLVFQLLEGGPVLDVPTDQPLCEDVARQYFRDALLGIEYLHYQRIVHRDIKPANLLLASDGAGGWRVQVADLGVCDEVRDHRARLSGAVGTPAFRAPEAMLSHDSFDGKAADIWSLGVTLYSLVTGCVPWTGGGGGVVTLQRHIADVPLEFPKATPLSAPLADLLVRMLDKNPATRIKMADIKTHEWVTRRGVDQLPSEQENCRLVEVTEEDLARVVTSIPNLSTLILIKTMLKNHSFQNPFLRSREGSTARGNESQEGAGVGTDGDAPAGEATARGTRPARPGLARSGRSVSAPGSYLTDRQPSFDVALASVQERDSIDADCQVAKKENNNTSQEQKSSRQANHADASPR